MMHRQKICVSAQKWNNVIVCRTVLWYNKSRPTDVLRIGDYFMSEKIKSTVYIDEAAILVFAAVRSGLCYLRL